MDKSNGVITKQSLYGVKESIDQFQAILSAKGITVFARIDQQDAARKAGLEMSATELLIFGNPLAGTPIMQAYPLAGLDLPLKLMAWTHDGATAWLTYNDAAWIGERYGLPPELAKKLDFGALVAQIAKP